MKIPTLFLSHPYTVLFLFFVLLVGVYIICRPRISRKADGGDQDKHPLRMIVIFFYIVTAMEIVHLLISYFRGAPSQVQLGNGLTSPDFQLKYQAWQISHPYAVLFIIFILLVGVYTICLPRLFRKANEGKKPLRNMLMFFCIANAMVIGALIISYFRGK